MNYTTLQSSIAGFLNRQDLAAVIPTFIELAEAAINRQIRHRRQIARSTNQLDALEHFIEMPTEFLQAKNIQLNTDPVTTLAYVTLEHADALRAGNGRGTGKPRYYTIVGSTLEMVPIPDAMYIVELTWYERVPTLTSAAPSNWLIEQFPDVYLYGALIHSAPYLKDDARVPVWGSLYERAVEHANLESDRAEVSGATPIARSTAW